MSSSSLSPLSGVRGDFNGEEEARQRARARLRRPDDLCCVRGSEFPLADRSAHFGRSMRWPLPISPRRLLVVLFVALYSIPGTLSSRLVTLDTIDIFTTHEWFPSKPTVYFRCSGDNKTHLPDVKEANLIYTFKGEESWQPLTELPENKCKRCGLYEEDMLLHDDVFDEWELCSSDFKDGKYTHFKEGQFNATFLCPNCTASAGAATHDSSSEVEAKKTSVVVIIIVSVLASVVVILALFGGYKYWLRKKRQRDQLRFLKLFEEGDDMDDELGLSNEF